ncbi:Homeodomain-like protein [Boletus edulis]|nr:Homeodomain-like protein [Boletus edulis]KAF8139087.1 Homeodomain-like protein [Boletus edulis]
MPQGQKTSTDIQWAIVRLSKFLDHERIGMCLNVSTRTVQRVLSHFHATGTIPNEKGGDEVVKRVRNKHLRDIDFLLGTVQKTPDLYLDELREILAQNCGVHVSLSSVWRTLRSAGFTMKKVCFKSFINTIQLYSGHVDHAGCSRKICK